jgi:hypothetical protein
MGLIKIHISWLNIYINIKKIRVKRYNCGEIGFRFNLEQFVYFELLVGACLRD